MSSLSNTPEQLKQFAASLQEELRPQRLIPALVAGAIASISAVMYAISFASLVYRGELAPYLPSGIGFALFSVAILNVIGGLRSSLPGMVIIIQDAPLVLTALIAQAIPLHMAGAAPSAILATVVVALGITAFLSGMTTFLLGWFKLGNLIRFVPYPVVGGFLAGTGWLLSLGAIDLLVDQHVSFIRLLPVLRAAPLLDWLPGCLFGLVLLIGLRRFSHVLLLPALLFAGVLLFYGILFITGTSIAEAREMGLFLNLTANDSLLPALPITALSQIDWAAIVTQSGTILGILLIMVLGLLLNTTGIELAVGQDMNLNQELKAMGIANFCCGFSSGMIGFHALGLSTLSYAKLGVRSRFVGIVVSLACLLVMIVGVSWITLFPKFVLGGLLLFLGLEFLADWLYSTWPKLPKTEYCIVLFISLAITILGFFEGVGLGLAIATALFVINYSRINVATQTLSGIDYQSNQVRTLPQLRLLREQGEQIYILRLQGFLFFGTVNQILALVRHRIQASGTTPLKFVVFDCRPVTGLDSSAVFGFVKLRQLAQRQNFHVVFTSLSPVLQKQLQRGDCFSELSDLSSCKPFPDLDRGLEWCEDQILCSTTWRRQRTLPLTLQFDEVFAASGHASIWMMYLEKRAIEPGQVLFQQGDPIDCIYFVQQGQLTAWLTLPDGECRRIQTAGTGDMIGEIDFFLGRSRNTSVVVDEPGQIYSLSRSALDALQNEHPEVAVSFQKHLIHLLSEHLAGTYREFSKFFK